MQSRDTGERQQGQRQDPFSQEQTSFTIPLFFQSLSGDILSPQNVRTQTQTLNRIQEIIKELCYQGSSAPQCEAPRSLMNEIGTNDSDEIKLLLSNKGKDYDDFATFLGKEFLPQFVIRQSLFYFV
jgi:hypothetical protein